MWRRRKKALPGVRNPTLQNHVLSTSLGFYSLKIFGGRCTVSMGVRRQCKAVGCLSTMTEVICLGASTFPRESLSAPKSSLLRLEVWLSWRNTHLTHVNPWIQPQHWCKVRYGDSKLSLHKTLSPKLLNLHKVPHPQYSAAESSPKQKAAPIPSIPDHCSAQEVRCSQSFVGFSTISCVLRIWTDSAPAHGHMPAC